MRESEQKCEKREKNLKKKQKKGGDNEEMEIDITKNK